MSADRCLHDLVRDWCSICTGKDDADIAAYATSSRTLGGQFADSDGRSYSRESQTLICPVCLEPTGDLGECCD